MGAKRGVLGDMGTWASSSLRKERLAQLLTLVSVPGNVVSLG